MEEEQCMHCRWCGARLVPNTFDGPGICEACHQKHLTEGRRYGRGSTWPQAIQGKEDPCQET